MRFRSFLAGPMGSESDFLTDSDAREGSSLTIQAAVRQSQQEHFKQRNPVYVTTAKFVFQEVQPAACLRCFALQWNTLYWLFY